MRCHARLGLLTLLLLIGTSASATTLSLTDCDAFGCQGSDVFLTVLDNGNGTWDVTLSLDSTGYNGSKTGVVQAGFKAIDGATAVTLDGDPNNPDDWAAAKLAGINSSGLCAGPDSGDFICTSGYTDVQSNGLYSWDFTVTGGTVIEEWTIKFQYGNATGVNRGNLISAPGVPGPPDNPIPEPSAALVFAGGMLVAATRLRRRR